MVSREQKIKQSVQDYVGDKLFNHYGYGQDVVTLLDAFPYNVFESALDRNYVACGFNFDDGGKQAELGSAMRRRTHTIEFWVFGLDTAAAENIATMLQTGLDADLVISLKDIGAVNDTVVIDYLIVESARAEQVPARDPRPWEEHVWIVRLKVTDEYDSSTA